MEGRSAVLSAYGVSRETVDRIDVFVTELHRWQGIKNLVGPATLKEVWTRHIADSLQLIDYGPQEGDWVDLGSGGGFPGLIVAFARAPQSVTHLIESNGRKCAFLRHVIRLTGVHAVVHHGRIEHVLRDWQQPVAVVSARALAPLADLIDLAKPLLRTGATGIFPKGQDVDRELTQAAISWSGNVTRISSRTDPRGCILVVRMAAEEGMKHVDRG